MKRTLKIALVGAIFGILAILAILFYNPKSAAISKQHPISTTTVEVIVPGSPSIPEVTIVTPRPTKAVTKAVRTAKKAVVAPKKDETKKGFLKRLFSPKPAVSTNVETKKKGFLKKAFEAVKKSSPPKVVRPTCSRNFAKGAPKGHILCRTKPKPQRL